MKTRTILLLGTLLLAAILNTAVADDSIRSMMAVFKPYEQSLEDHLRRAALEGDVASIERLAAKGAKINAMDRDGWTALTLAVAQNHKEAVLALLRLGAKPNLAGKSRHTPLGWAVIRGSTDMVQILLAHGADIDARDEKGWTALMEASARGYIDVVELLLSKGAHPNARGPFGATALNVAKLYGTQDVVNLLLAKGADPSIKLQRVAIAEGVTVPMPHSNSSQNATALAAYPQGGASAPLTENVPEAKYALCTMTNRELAPDDPGGGNLPYPQGGTELSEVPVTGQLTEIGQPSASQLDRRRERALTLLKQGMAIWNQLNAEYPEIARRLQELARNRVSLEDLAREMHRGLYGQRR